MKNKLTYLIVFFALVGCGNDDIEPTVDVAISNGKLQCQDNALSVETTKGYLLEAGINVLSQRCGRRNSAVLAACGVTENQIHVYTINANNLIDAENAGFIQTSNIEEGYTTIDC